MLHPFSVRLGYLLSVFLKTGSVPALKAYIFMDCFRFQSFQRVNLHAGEVLHLHLRGALEDAIPRRRTFLES